MSQLPDLPARRGARRRDRHGRGLRGPLLAPALPGRKSRSERFDRLVAASAARLVALNPALAAVQFGIEEIPPSDPSPWERGAVALGRYFPADRTTGVATRIVVYRRPVMTRAATPADLIDLVRGVLAEQAASALGLTPGEVDPDFRF